MISFTGNGTLRYCSYAFAFYTESLSIPRDH